MNSSNHETNHEVLTTDLPISLLKRLQVRDLQPHEYQPASELLGRERYLGDAPQERPPLGRADPRPPCWLRKPQPLGARRLSACGTHSQACMREDKARSQNYRLYGNLSALRVCLVALKADLHAESSWPQLQECCQHDPHIPLQALLKHRAK